MYARTRTHRIQNHTNNTIFISLATTVANFPLKLTTTTFELALV